MSDAVSEGMDRERRNQVNAVQVGGDHYRDKCGVEDLRKAKHYLEHLIAVEIERR